MQERYFAPPPLTRVNLNILLTREEMDSARAKLALAGGPEREKLQRMVSFLSQPELQDLIHEGKITLAGIKPRAQESKLGVENDDEGELALMGMIQPPLEPILSVSVLMTSKDVDAFYGKKIRESLSAKKVDNTNIWEIYKGNIMSGPITFMLLYHPDGKAVTVWRKKMGDTNPAEANRRSIRGKYASSTEKNLVHGSSGGNPGERRENVAREIEWLRNKLIAIKLDSENGQK